MQQVVKRELGPVEEGLQPAFVQASESLATTSGGTVIKPVQEAAGSRQVGSEQEHAKEQQNPRPPALQAHKKGPRL
jgi:hypothetical protein